MTITSHSNQPSSAQAERLAYLAKELGEAQQAISKILRHGHESLHPGNDNTNREALESELGDVVHAIALTLWANDIRESAVTARMQDRAAEIHTHLHHQPAELLQKLEKDVALMGSGTCLTKED